MWEILSSANAAACSAHSLCFAVAFFTNLFSTTAAAPTTGTTLTEMPKRVGLRLIIWYVANAQELQLRNKFAKVVVTDSDALLTSSVRTDPIAPGDVDTEATSSVLPLLSSSASLSLLSLVFLPPPPETNHSISLSFKTALKSFVRKLFAMLSCALLSMTVRKNDANPPPMTTTARALEALPEFAHVVLDELFSSSSLPRSFGSAEKV